MRSKPDLLWILIIVFGLGVVTTGYTQGFLESGPVSGQIHDPGS